MCYYWDAQIFGKLGVTHVMNNAQCSRKSTHLNKKSCFNTSFDVFIRIYMLFHCCSTLLTNNNFMFQNISLKSRYVIFTYKIIATWVYTVYCSYQLNKTSHATNTIIYLSL